MPDETQVESGFTPTDPGFGADASSESEEKPVEVDAEAGEPEDTEKSEADSPSAVEENDDEKTSPKPGDIEYTQAVKDRMDELTDSFRSSERAGEVKDQRIAELEEQIAEHPQQAEPLKSLADFEFDEDKYRSYLFDEANARAESMVDKKLRDFRVRETTETLQSKFRNNEKEFVKTVPDYYEKVYGEVDGVRPWNCSADMVIEFHKSDVGLDMAYYLATNPKVAAEIAVLDNRNTVRRMQSLETEIRAEKGKASKKVSDAPPPTSKLKAGNAGVKPSTTSPASDKMSDKEWFDREEKRVAKQRGQ